MIFFIFVNYFKILINYLEIFLLIENLVYFYLNFEYCIDL